MIFKQNNMRFALLTLLSLFLLTQGIAEVNVNDTSKSGHSYRKRGMFQGMMNKNKDHDRSSHIPPDYPSLNSEMSSIKTYSRSVLTSTTRRNRKKYFRYYVKSLKKMTGSSASYLDKSSSTYYSVSKVSSLNEDDDSDNSWIETAMDSAISVSQIAQSGYQAATAYESGNYVSAGYHVASALSKLISLAATLGLYDAGEVLMVGASTVFSFILLFLQITSHNAFSTILCYLG